MPLTTGTRLGPYEIAELIGAGGMGEVYRAHDTRLGRDVAIKVLPGAFAQDADRLARFEREARSIAALSHQNILAIHDTGTHDGHVFVVTELLEGETLRARVQQGPMPVRKATDIAIITCESTVFEDRMAKEVSCRHRNFHSCCIKRLLKSIDMPLAG